MFRTTMPIRTRTEHICNGDHHTESVLTEMILWFRITKTSFKIIVLPVIWNNNFNTRKLLNGVTPVHRQIYKRYVNVP